MPGKNLVRGATLRERPDFPSKVTLHRHGGNQTELHVLNYGLKDFELGAIGGH